MTILCEGFELSVNLCCLLLLQLFFISVPELKITPRWRQSLNLLNTTVAQTPQETGHVTHIGAHMKGEIAYQVHSVALHCMWLQLQGSKTR